MVFLTLLTNLKYFQAQSGISYLPSSGSTTFEDGQSEAIIPVDIESGVYIRVDSTFTFTLTAAAFIGIGGMNFATCPFAYIIGSLVIQFYNNWNK